MRWENLAKTFSRDKGKENLKNSQTMVFSNIFPKAVIPSIPLLSCSLIAIS